VHAAAACAEANANGSVESLQLFCRAPVGGGFDKPQASVSTSSRDSLQHTQTTPTLYTRHVISPPLIHPEFLRLLWVLADMQTVKYFNLVGDEEDIRNERFKWSRASTFSYNRNAIGLAVAYASGIRTHLSVHGTGPMKISLRTESLAADKLTGGFPC